MKLISILSSVILKSMNLKCTGCLNVVRVQLQKECSIEMQTLIPERRDTVLPLVIQFQMLFSDDTKEPTV